jgi:hypothetical protein
MTTQEQQTMDVLSRTVSALCEGIDPSFTHGPETEKLVLYAKKTRKLAEELAIAAQGNNRTYQLNKARELLEHLNGNRAYEPRPNGGITKFP